MRCLLLLLICALGAVSGETASAQTWEELTSSNEAQLELAIANDSVPVFERPSFKAAVTRTLLPNEGVWVYDTWRHFYAVAKSGEGHVGYVARDRLRVEASPSPPNHKSQLEVFAENNPEATIGVVRASGAQLYANPSEEARILRTANPGAHFLVTGDEGQFYSVTKLGDGTSMYVLAENLRLRQDPAKEVVQNLPPKDPGLGTLFSVLITGGGQFYAGRSGKGSLLMLIGIGAPAIGYGMTIGSVDVSCDSNLDCTDQTDYAPLYLGAAVGFGAWVVGVATADDDVREYNEQVRSTNTVTVAPVLLRGRPALAMRVRW